MPGTGEETPWGAGETGVGTPLAPGGTGAGAPLAAGAAIEGAGAMPAPMAGDWRGGWAPEGGIWAPMEGPLPVGAGRLAGAGPAGAAGAPGRTVDWAGAGAAGAFPGRGEAWGFPVFACKILGFLLFGVLTCQLQT